MSDIFCTLVRQEVTDECPITVCLGLRSVKNTPGESNSRRKALPELPDNAFSG
jgi:hypothetical protein